MVIILLASMLIASFAISSVSACATWTPGYWKNHYPWTARTATTYEGWGFVQSFPIPSNALEILGMPVKGDARINLQQKVIAASLSILTDMNWGWDTDTAYGTPLPTLVAQANALLNANPGQWTPNSLADQSGVRAEGLSLASQIDIWLNALDQ